MILKKCDLDHFTKCGQFSNISPHLKKTDAEPGNSNNQSLANSSTPFNRAFFIRSTRTPKEHALSVLLSMVTCSGKGFALCCVPVIAVFQPVIRYRQFKSLETLTAVTLKQFTGVTKMFYKFILLGKNRLHLTILADSEQQARNRLTLTRAICYARINPNHHRTLGGAYV